MVRNIKPKKQVIEEHYDYLKELVAQVFEGQDIDDNWLVSPKVEIRALEKLMNIDPEKNKQRTFMCGGLVAYIVMTMLYYNQNCSLHRLGPDFRSWYAVGISPFYGQWHSLAEKLKLAGDKFDCLDMSHMEASLSPRILEIIYRLRNKYGEESTRKAREWVFDNLCYSKVRDLLGRLLIKLGMNPSGSLNTLDDNTLALLFIIIYALSRQGLSDDEIIRFLEDEVFGKLGGDDSIFNSHPLLADLPSYAAELGFKAEYEIAPGSPLSEATFFSSGFHYDLNHKMYIPKPNFDKLFAGLYWWRKEDSWRLTLAKLCALRILTYPYPKKFQEIETLISYILEKHDDDLHLEKRMDDKITYSQLMSMMLSTEQMEFLWFGLEKAGSDLSEDVLDNILSFL